ncbi:outer membrane beta-barrel protein [Legionella sp. CNM-4043-24]|uniref:outer membrane beta-barrel protein n=1 Tax=Legionella sp. CNM-4043-24 TaxID=3421646 RepID=UPI00403B1551
MNKVIKMAVLPAALFLQSGLTQAAVPGAYLGLGAGWGTLQEQQDYNKKEDSQFAGRAFAGFNFNRYFGLEVNYARFGTTRFLLNFNPNLGIDTSLNALSMVGKIYLPLSDNSPFNIYAMAGAAQMHARYSYLHDNQSFYRESASGLVATGGAGISYDINRHLSTSFEFSAYDEREASSDHLGIPGSALATLGLTYRF